jgi:LPS sulfotransferase NodH
MRWAEDSLSIEDQHVEQNIRIVYIMGCHRSGSTLLDTILGSHPQIESVGELYDISQRGWVAQTSCACGEPAAACPFWLAIRREWARVSGRQDEPTYGALVRAMEKRRLWLPRLAAEIRRGSPRFNEYAHRTRALFQAIQTVSGKTVIVDSSKRRSRVLLLSAIAGIDLRVIHLVRDPRGVVWSAKKRLKPQGPEAAGWTTRSQPAWKTAGFWSFCNLQSQWVRDRLPAVNSMQLRYEDYVTDPTAAMAQLGRFIGVDLGPVTTALLAGEQMRIGHTIAGNPLRKAGQVRMRGPDLEWVEKLLPLDRRTCWALSGWLMRKYGYGKYPERLSAAAASETPPPRAGESTDLFQKEMAA